MRYLDLWKAVVKPDRIEKPLQQENLIELSKRFQRPNYVHQMIEDSQVLLVLLKMQCKTPLPFTRQECALQD